MSDPVKPTPKLLAKDFNLAQFQSNRWAIRLLEGQSVEDCLKDSFWANIAAKLKRGDVIEVRNDECTMYAELFVRAVPLQGSPMTWAKVAILREPVYFDLPTAIPDQKAFRVSWNVGGRSYDVRRVADNEVVSRQHPTREQAEAWIADHLLKIAA